jgi:predicted metal-dependent phosphoesterase TrpH
MHIHTWASDGTWSPEILIGKLNEEKIKIFSITDHDTIKSSEEMLNLSFEKEMKFIPGVEVASTYKNREYHLTVYNYNKTTEFLDLINWNNGTRLEYNYKFLDLMSKKHDSVSLNDYFDNYVEDRTKGGWKALNYLIDKGIYRTIFDYFDGLKETDLTICFKEPEEVIEMAKREGSSVFLAHPSYYFRDGVMGIEELDFWKNAGINGVECYTPYAPDKDRIDYYKDYCNKNDLMISGGSDCHGDFLTRKLGYPDIDVKDLRINSLLDMTELL